MIKIVDIDQISDDLEADRVEYFVEFDDGFRYEGVTDSEGFGNEDGLDDISALRIGDEFRSMTDFYRFIHGESVEVENHLESPTATARYTVSCATENGGNAVDYDSIDEFMHLIEDARAGKIALTVFDNETQEILFWKPKDREGIDKI